ncbi:hypothetical protein V6N11_029314 [Hibiscus sabdariffa]|uniref:Uncharacterized protein n=2 Tax=Hibiscus sabdariffa TaxID=183260 RepID=A0ABR2NEJ7_9ROSI
MDTRGVGSCPRSKAFAYVGEPNGQSLDVGVVLCLCTIELVATIRMTRCATSHSRSGRANSNETDLQYYFPPTKNYSSSLYEEQDTTRRITANILLPWPSGKCQCLSYRGCRIYLEFLRENDIGLSSMS